MSRLFAFYGEYDQRVTQLIATPEPSLRTIHTSDRLFHSVRLGICHHIWVPLAHLLVELKATEQVEVRTVILVPRGGH